MFHTLYRAPNTSSVQHREIFDLGNPRLQHLKVFRRHTLCIYTTRGVFVVTGKQLFFTTVTQPSTTLIQRCLTMVTNVTNVTYGRQAN
jgi:hypothetical protein